MTVPRTLGLDALVGKRVVDADGRVWGRVTEIKMDGSKNPPVVETLLVGYAALIIRLGFRGRVRRLARRWLPAYVAPWETVTAIGADIRVRDRPTRWR